jgi:nucleoside-diphosphate-sugar epimerase
MNKVLIVGGAGYIGGALTDIYSYISNNSDEITVYDSLLYERDYRKDVEFIRGDIRDTEKLSKILPNYDIVVWLAALVGDGACEVNPKLTKEINEDSVKWLCDNYNGRIIFISTCSVYGINNNKHITEEEPTNPISLYAITKLNAEKYVLQKPNSLVFRLGTVYGIGDNYSRIRMDLVVNQMSYRASLGKPLIVHGGSQVRPIIHVRDVASYIYNAGIKSNCSGLYNLSYSNYNILEIAKKINNLYNVGIEVVEQNIRDLRHYHVSCNKLYNNIGDVYNNMIYKFRDDNLINLYDLFKSGRINNLENPIFRNEQYLKELYGK